MGESGKDERGGRFTLFISNLPLFITDNSLSTKLNAFLQSQVTFKIKGCRVVRDRDGHSRGIAYVDLEDQDKLIKAVSLLNGKDALGVGVSLRVRESKPPQENDDEVRDRTLFVNHLPSSIREEEIVCLFSKIGEIKEVRLK
jgi:RNA recognition motif-containing protein